MAHPYNLLAPENIQDPYPLYAELRERAPVCQVEPLGNWAVSRYEDVAYVLKHPELFSSTGNEEARQQLLDPRLQGDDLFGKVNVISSDPPVHTQLRKLIGGAFTPRAIARLEERVRVLTAEYLDRIVGRDGFDMMADLAVPLPITMISEMLGVDPARRADFKRWSDDIINVPRGTRALRDEEVERILRSRRETRAYFRGVVEQRKRRLGDDLVSDLLRGEAEYGVLEDEDVLGMVVLLLIAGNETTTHLIGNGTLALLDHPEAERLLRADPAQIPAFVEEVLRYCGPVRMLTRRTVRDVTLAGVTIPEGAIVMPLLASANRDPAQFVDPDRFDITRPPRSHVAFGYGIHFCVGAPLSRVEGKVAFGEILQRLPRFRRVAGPLVWGESTVLRGLRELPLRFDRQAAAA